MFLKKNGLQKKKNKQCFKFLSVKHEKCTLIKCYCKIFDLCFVKRKFFLLLYLNKSKFYVNLVLFTKYYLKLLNN